MASTRRDPEGDFAGTYPGSGYMGDSREAMPLGVGPNDMVQLEQAPRLQEDYAPKTPEYYKEVARVGLESARAALAAAVDRRTSNRS